MSITRPIRALASATWASTAARSVAVAGCVGSSASTSAPRSVPTSATNRCGPPAPSGPGASSVSTRSYPDAGLGEPPVETQKQVPAGSAQATATRNAPARRRTYRVSGNPRPPSTWSCWASAARSHARSPITATGRAGSSPASVTSNCDPLRLPRQISSSAGKKTGFAAVGAAACANTRPSVRATRRYLPGPCSSPTPPGSSSAPWTSASTTVPVRPLGAITV